MEFFKHTKELPEGTVELVLCMEVGLDPRLGCTVPEQIEILSRVEAYKAPEDGQWYIPVVKEYTVGQLLMLGLPQAAVASPDYVAVLDSATPIESSTALMMLDPIEAAAMLVEARRMLLNVIPQEGIRVNPDDANGMADRIGSALEEWGLLPKGS